MEMSRSTTRCRGPGRPPTPAAERVTTVRLRRCDVDLVDAVIRDQAERRGDNPAEIDYSQQRRTLIGRVIEAKANIETLLPTQVRARAYHRVRTGTGR